MADPTDLIRAVDEALNDELLFNYEQYVLALLRRLRDALAASEAEAEHLTQVFMQHAADLGRMEGERDEAREERGAALALLDRERAALAEANATIERALELAAYLESKSGTTDAAIRRSVATEFRRAVEGPQA